MSLFAVAAIGSPSIVRADTVVLEPIKDNTLIENDDGALSNGAGEGIFTGRLANPGQGKVLRAMLAFDLSSVPPGSTVTSVSLKLTLLMGVGGNQLHSLHRVTGDWGEAGSSAFGGLGSPAGDGDATWLHTFFSSSLWTHAGGDFVASSSANKTVPNSGSVTIASTPALIADVQAWVNDPAANFGWMIRGNEITLMTAKKFASREYRDPLGRPKLTIAFTPPPPPPPCPADIAPAGGDGAVDVDDLFEVINGWGPCADAGNCPSDISPATTAGDGTVDIDDLFAVINSWGDCP